MIKEARNVLKDVSYEEMKESWKLRERLIEEAAEEELQSFTGPMKLAYVEYLVAVFNGEATGMPEKRALRLLRKLLNRPDFGFIAKHYKNLKNIVEDKYAESVENNIILS